MTTIPTRANFEIPKVHKPHPTAEALLDRMGDPLDEADYDWSSPGNPLSDDEVCRLRCAAQVEWSTEGTFASLDVFTDPIIGAFLHHWPAQEVVHGELIARFLEARGHAVHPLHTEPGHLRGGERSRRLSRLIRAALGDDLSAVHMTWGAVDELTKLRFYGLIRAGSRDPLLCHLLRDIVAQEAIHYGFCYDMARRRLEVSARARRLTRWALTHLWAPVGQDLRGEADTTRLMALFAEHPKVTAQMDRAISSLPGLQGLDLIQRTID